MQMEETSVTNSPLQDTRYRLSRREVMKHTHLLWKTALLISLVQINVHTQVSQTDYERAASLRTRFQRLAVDIVDRPTWIGKTSHFWYRKSVKGGNEFVLVDAETLTKKPAFDHEKLAAALSSAGNRKYTGLTLPFTTINFVDGEQGIEFVAETSRFRCSLADYSCQKLGPAPGGQAFRRQDDNPEEE